MCGVDAGGIWVCSAGDQGSHKALSHHPWPKSHPEPRGVVAEECGKLLDVWHPQLQEERRLLGAGWGGVGEGF